MRLFLGLCATLIALGVAELGFRLGWVKQLTMGAGIEHPHFHHRLKPYTTYRFMSSEFDAEVRTNRFGLRGQDPVLPKPAGVVRILMLGDSFTFGFTVRDEETFCHLIEADLKKHGYPAEVINGGVSGYSPTLHYISLRDEFLAFEPDLVILWYDLGDIQEDHWFQKNLIFDDAGRLIRCDPRYRNGRFDTWQWAKRHSALAKYLDVKLLRTLDRIRILGVTGYVQAKLRGERSKVAVARLLRQQHSDALAGVDKFFLVREPISEALIRRHWVLSATYLLMIRDLLAQRGIPFVLGIYPYGMLAGPDQWAEGRVAWGFEKDKLYHAAAFRAVVGEFSAREGIPLIDPFERFRGAAQSQQLFYDWDGHFTLAGHRVLANHVLNDAGFLSIFNRTLAKKRP